MTTAVVILAVALFVVAAVAVILAKRGAARKRHVAELSETAESLSTDLDSLRVAVSERQAELDARVTSATEERDTFEARVGELEIERSRLQKSLDESFSEVSDVSDELVQRDADLLHARAAVFEAETAAAAAMGRAGESRGDLEKAQAELVALRNELADAKVAEGSAPDGSRPDPAPLVVEALWALERTRVERTWRQSVAADPSDPSPFSAGGDPARVAVEVEVAAIREEVGSDLSADWQIDDELPVGDGLLVVRAAQELLATAARTVEQGVLVVARQDGSIRLSVADPDGDQVALSGLVDLSVVPGSHLDGAALVIALPG
ncbi:MAG TPA: hypothetical protein VIY72_07655 [Acidimicrobiales bacterium]